jgi:uncharacterized membrane protein YgcG
MKLKRLLRHLLMPGLWMRRHFSRADRQAIEAAIRDSESHHRGELRFVAEGPLHLAALLKSTTPRQRAVELFSQLRVWDTEENSGILIYVQLVDRKVEILADRGIAAQVPQAEWQRLCRGMEHHFAQGRYRQGVLEALASAGKLLTTHFPATGNNPNELPDAPLIL